MQLIMAFWFHPSETEGTLMKTAVLKLKDQSRGALWFKPKHIHARTLKQGILKP